MYEYDYYNILNVRFDADSETIKASYRKLAKVYHPDLGGSDYEFKKINEAYKTLSDSKQRAEYDEWYRSTYTVEPPKKSVTKDLICVYDTASNSKTMVFFENMDYNRYPKEKYTNSEGHYFALRTHDFDSRLNKPITRVVICTPKEFYNRIDENIKEIRRQKTLNSMKHFTRIIAVLVGIVAIGSFFLFLNFYPTTDVDEPTYEETDNSLIECDVPTNGELYYSMQKRYYDTNGKLVTVDVDGSPLKIQLPDTGNNYYYIKLVDDYDNIAQAVFMYPNTSIEIKVPYGEYKLKYACGDTWYGYDDLFGPDGSYVKSDTVLTLSEDLGFRRAHKWTGSEER